MSVKFAVDRPYSQLEIANSIEAIQNSRISIEKITGPFLGFGRKPGRRNTRPTSPWRSHAIGCNCTRAEPISSFRQARICSPGAELRSLTNGLAEAKWWSHELGREQLRNLVDKVGNSAATVRKE